MKRFVYLIGCLLSFCSLQAQEPADFVLPAIISDHAVMQRDADVKLWGWCPSVWELKIVCSWAPTDTVRVSSDKHNYWETQVRTPREEGPHTLRFYGWENKLFAEVKDILMGESWLCSGQSNMEYCFKWRVDDAGDRSQLFNNPKIRYFKVPKASSAYPVERIGGQWELFTPETAEEFSVAAYFFGKRLNEALDDVPVGLIGSYWGGTAIEPWIDGETFRCAELVKKSEKLAGSWAPTANSSLYNAMIHPVKNYAVAGAIWYQGEANNDRASDYGNLFEALINGWRAAFQQALPFYFVQIAPWNGYAGKNGAYLREQQADVAATVENTSMVVVADLVNDLSDIHPSLKRQVGDRLGNMALHRTYHQKGVQPDAPALKGFTISGRKVIVSTTAAGKLVCREKEIRHFEIVDASGHLHPAQATLLKSGDISVTAPRVKNPVGVRYCFSNDAMPDLFDTNGLPLAPFRTDRKK